MEDDFKQIKAEYDQFYKDLLSQGKMPHMETALGYWGVSVSEEVFELFKRTKLNQHTNFLDLGHGDGKVALIASLFTNASGIECDEWLVNQSLHIKENLSHIENVKNARLLYGDYTEHDLSHYDYLFSLPDQRFSSKLVSKLLSEASGAKLIVHGNVFLPTKVFKSEQTHEINGTVYHEFRIP